MGAAQLWQGRHTDLGWLEKANLVIAASLTAASAILLHALAVSDFTLEYVAGYTVWCCPVLQDHRLLGRTARFHAVLGAHGLAVRSLFSAHPSLQASQRGNQTVVLGVLPFHHGVSSRC